MNEFERNTVYPAVSVQYPGTVKCVSNMLETLGGIKMISSVYAEKNRRLELRFRPKDDFCKPCYASRKPVAALLLKVKVKKSKSGERKIISCSAVNYITEEYKFVNLCDFQFLPSSPKECFYDTVVPKNFDLDWLNSPSPYFLPPAAFSRIDTVQNFNFTKLPVEEEKPNVIGRLKRKRYGCTKFLSFDNPEVPTVPKNVPYGGICSAKMVTNETLQHLKTERPIYSKCAIRCISKLPLVQLKCLLPCVAYYFLNGPWRSLWVRFGYDPRKDPSARIYQTLDYRVRSQLSKDEIKIKKSVGGGSCSYKFSNQPTKNVSVITRNPTETNEKNDEEELEKHIFRPGTIPPSRQCYYQYCDIHIPEVKAMLDNLKMIDENAICHEIDGWLPPTTADTCRDIMNRYVAEELKRRNKLGHQARNPVVVDNQSSVFSGSESDFSDSEYNQ